MQQQAKPGTEASDAACGSRDGDPDIAPPLFQAFSTLVGEIYAVARECNTVEPVLRSMAGITGSQFAAVYAWEQNWRCCRLLECSLLPPDTPEDFAWLTEVVSIYRPPPKAINTNGVVVFAGDALGYGQPAPKPAEDWAYALLWFIRRGGRSAVIALTRPRKQGDYSATDKWLLRELLPHLRRSFSIWEVIESLQWQQTAGLEALDQLHTGILLVDEAGHVAFANLAAERLCRGSCGLRLTRTGIHALGNGSNAQLQAAMKRASVSASGKANFAVHSVVIPRHGAQRPLVITCVPIPGMPHLFLRAQPRVILLIRDPDIPLDEKCELLEELYCLTKSEARVALDIADGETVVGIAAKENCSEATVRNTLKRVFHKTAVHSQSELAALIGKTVLP